MKKTAIAAALLLVAGAANAAPVTQLTLTGGSFAMGTPGDEIFQGEFSGDIINADTNPTGYIGGARNAADLASNSIGYFQYATFGPVLISTMASDDVTSGFRPVTGDLTGDVLTLDLDAWTAWYGGVLFNQGTSTRCVEADYVVVFPGDENCSSGDAVTTYDAATGTYTATWSAVVVGGGFNNNVGTWTIEGTVSAVPVPAAVWLFGSGLVGLAGIARRRKTA